MKKVLNVLVILVLLFGFIFVGCGGAPASTVDVVEDTVEAVEDVDEAVEEADEAVEAEEATE